MNVGIDCVGLPICVGNDLGLWEVYLSNYPAQPDGRMVDALCEKYMRRKLVTEMQVGDVLTMAIPTHPCHVGIVTSLHSMPALVHAFNGGTRSVIEHNIDNEWYHRVRSCFAFPGVGD